MATLLKQEAGRLSASPTTLPTPPTVTPHFDGTKYEAGPAKERRKIRIAHKGLPYGHDDYLYLLFLLYVLKRKEGPIYQNIREQGGLTYMLDIHSFSSLGVGYFGVVLECAAENVDTVLSKLGESMHQVLQEIKDERNFQTWLQTFCKKQRFL